MLNRLCCMRLNTAAVVIGWLGCVGSAVSLALLSVLLAKADEVAKWIWDNMKDKDDVTVGTIQTFLTILFAIYLVSSAIHLVTSSLLILGAKKERHLLLLPWLINSGASLLFNIIIYVIVIVQQISAGAPFGLVLVNIIVYSLIGGITYVIWYAMYSHYKQLQAASDQQQQLLPHSTTTYPSYTQI